MVAATKSLHIKTHRTYGKHRMALSLQSIHSLLQPFSCNLTGRNVQQPKPRHGDRCGNQLGKKVIVETVARNAQLGEAGLKF